MKDTDFDHPNPNRDHSIPPLQLFWYLIPVVGFFPALWTLYHQDPTGMQGSESEGMGRDKREQRAVSRLSVTLAGSWLLGYVLLGAGAQTWEFLTLRLLLLNGLLTSGYFLVSLWLIVRLWQRKYPRLPGFSRLANRMLGKHLS